MDEYFFIITLRGRQRPMLLTSKEEMKFRLGRNKPGTQQEIESCERLPVDRLEPSNPEVMRAYVEGE